MKEITKEHASTVSGGATISFFEEGNFLISFQSSSSYVFTGCGDGAICLLTPYNAMLVDQTNGELSTINSNNYINYGLNPMHITSSDYLSWVCHKTVS